ncbi:LysR family transcriptional regulator [Martelella alba]|uniref:LysR family transcriptional regulator n=1 Tax=Martelella alba TaxID=2590451 RepID=A0A506UDA9_9HYPH|nr:LysR family transcriptional regulator [Martelella alba]TPW31396.1 LysR family transcriptional regulator [Martelella alba]
MVDLAQLRAVRSVAQRQGFRAAATDLGMSRSALSHCIAALEKQLGVRIFHRTTRSVTLTEAGEAFLKEIEEPLGNLLIAVENAGNTGGEPQGTLRLNASLGAARQIMTPILLEFLRQYPKVTIDLVTEGKPIDVIEAGFDAGIRLAELVPKDMIAIPLGPEQRFAVVATPEYFRRHPPPATPADLKEHHCLRTRLPDGGLYRWEFERRGERVNLDGVGQLILDEPLLTLEAVRAGFGVAYLSEWNVSEDLASGRLVRVLDDWTRPYPGLCLYYSGRRHMPPVLRAMVDMLRDR